MTKLQVSVAVLSGCRVDADTLLTRCFERSKRLKKFAKSKASEEGEGTDTAPRSALELRYDWQLHQMVGYMRRVDGVRKTLVQRLPCMNPLARDGEPDFATDGSRTPFFWILGLCCLV